MDKRTKSKSRQRSRSRTTSIAGGGGGPAPSPSSSAHRIPPLVLSSRATSTVANEVQEIPEVTLVPQPKAMLSKTGPSTGGLSDGEILLAPNFKMGDCVPGGRGGRCGEPISRHPLQSSYSEGTLGGGGERASDLGDKLFIYGGYRDKFLYLYGSQISSEAKRKDFTIFLRTSGILQLISKFILGLQEMPFRPPPEQVVEFMVKSMGSKFVMRDTLKEMRAYRDDTKKRIELLQTESDELRLRLEKYCTIYTPYEALDPEDFAHLASTQPDQPPFISPMDFIFPPEMRAISPILGPGEGDEEEEEDGEQDKFETITDVVVELVARNRAAAASQQAGQEQLPTEPLPTPPPQNNAEEVVAKPDGELEESEPGGKKLQQSLDEASAMIRRQVLISAQEKYGQMAVIERDDLDIEGLLQHFKALGPNMFASIKSSKMKLTSAKSRNLDDCANLPLVEIPMTSEDRMRGQMEGMLQAGGASEPKMPPFVLTQMRKYTQGTTIFREPQGQIIKSGE